jgi:molybdopterin-guanine dinucleotide biosynthesis protein A
MVEAGAIILAGGESSRFGRNKLTVEFQGKPLIQHVVDTAAQVVGEIYLAGAGFEVSASCPITKVADELPGQGPLAGLASALSHQQIHSQLHTCRRYASGYRRFIETTAESNEK